MEVISTQEIESTEAFKQIDKSIQPLYLKRVNREKISHALVVYRNTNYLDESLGRHSLNIAKELIKIEEDEK